MRFVHESLPQRVVLATGGAAEAVAAEVDRLGTTRLMVIASASARALADRLTAPLPVVLRHDGVAEHVPVDEASRARATATERGVDAVVCVGGGSATGLAKAVALDHPVPVLAVPTTYSGSEVTPVWGLTESGRKRTGVDPRVLPRAVVYDAELLRTLPRDVAVASGLNALAHAVDALWAPRAEPVAAALAAEGVRALDRGLRLVARDPAGVGGIETALLGAYLAARAFAAAGSGLHHTICHVLGGRFGLPHASTHAVVLPHVLALNAPYADEAAARLADAFGAASATAGLAGLYDAVDAPRALRDLGLDEADLVEATEAVLAAAPASNPAPLTAEAVASLLRAAWGGGVR